MSEPVLAMIVAAASNGVIGRDNALPWHLPEDLRYFKATTMGKPLIMGRKTFESIGRPLPGRANIVVTGNTQWQAEGVEVAHSLEQAVQLGREEARRQGVDEVMVIGGAAVYSALLPQAERLYYTEVHAEVDGDAYLPSINWRQWREISRQRHSAPEYDYSFVVCERDMTQ